MKKLTIAFLVAASIAGSASAQSVPITLSATEYDALIGILISRDQVLSGLVQKQNEARNAAAAAAKAKQDGATQTPASAASDK